jgi:hypothetical protein
VNHDQLAVHELDCKDFEGNAFAVRSQEKDCVVGFGSQRVDGVWAPIDDESGSLVADPVSGRGCRESNDQAMDLIVADIIAAVHRADDCTRHDDADGFAAAYSRIPGPRE